MRWLVAWAVVLAPGVARADGGGYSIKLADRIEVAVGAEAAPSLTVAPAAEHTISRRGPLLIELDVAPAEGLTLRQRRYRREDAADERADAPRFDLRMRAVAPGDYRIDVELAFWVCRRFSCWPISAARQLTVTVAPPTPPDAGVDAPPP